MSEYATTVVRLFRDYADSDVWFSDPVPYAQTELDTRLIADLESWDASYHAGLNSDHEWRRAGLANQFHAEGARLARRLADRIGDDFEVQYDLGESYRRVHGSGTPCVFAAAAAFQQMASAAREDWVSMRQVVEEADRDGHTLG